MNQPGLFALLALLLAFLVRWVHQNVTQILPIKASDQSSISLLGCNAIWYLDLSIWLASLTGATLWQNGRSL